MDLYGEARRRSLQPRILVSRLRYLGDIILTTPVISALKRCYPDAEIYYLTETQYAPILLHHPDLTGVISLGKGSRASMNTVIRLRRMRFTAAVDLFYNPRSAWLLYLAGIPIRIGGSRRWRRRLYTDVFTVPRGVRSAVAHHLHPIGVLGCAGEEERPRIHLTADERERGTKLVSRILGGRGGIAVHPGGTWPAKRWPPELFGRSIARIADRTGLRTLLVTGPGEDSIVREVARHAPDSAAILPLLPLRTLAGVLASCRAVVANDGGVLHMAVALGLPTVGVFGPTEPDIWFPYEGWGPYRLVTRNEDCAPCHRHFCEDKRCMNLIEPDDVVTKLLSVIGGVAVQ